MRAICTQDATPPARGQLLSGTDLGLHNVK
jgi:hypothetical protein